MLSPTGCYAIGSPEDSRQLTAQRNEPAAYKGMALVAKIKAGTVLEAIQNVDAKVDLAKCTAKTPDVCPIPEGVAPPLQMSAGLQRRPATHSGLAS